MPRLDYNEIWNVLSRYLAALLPIIIGVIWLAIEMHSFFMAMMVVDNATASDLAYEGPGLLILIGVVFWPLLTLLFTMFSYLFMAIRARMLGALAQPHY